MSRVRRLPCEVSSVRSLSEDVFWVTLTPEGRLPRFKAGQFLHLTLDPFDPSEGFWPESRVFSIASGPEDPVLEIHYSVKGAYTARMRRELIPGRQVWVKLPYGEFVVQAGSPSETALVAGGTGIAPFVPLLRQLLASRSEEPLRLLFGFRDPALCPIEELLLQCRDRLPNLGLELLAERHDRAPFAPGRLSAEPLTHLINDFSTARFYLSGPPSMVAYFQAELTLRDVTPERVIIDAWE